MASIAATSAEVEDSQLCQSCEWKLMDFLLLTANSERLDEFLYSHGVLSISAICECRNAMKFDANKNDFSCHKRYTVLN
jgi:hypothetical protein